MFKAQLEPGIAGMQEGGRYSLDPFVRDIDARERVRLEIFKDAVVHARTDNGDDVGDGGMCAVQSTVGGPRMVGDANRKARVNKAMEGAQEKVDAA